MTISEAITRTDGILPGGCTGEEKRRLLSELDSKISLELLGGTEALDYGESSPDTELLVPAPYDEIYIYWISYRTELALGELARANNSAELFGNEYSAYRNHRNRLFPHTRSRIKLY